MNPWLRAKESHFRHKYLSLAFQRTSILRADLKAGVTLLFFHLKKQEMCELVQMTEIISPVSPGRKIIKS